MNRLVNAPRIKQLKALLRVLAKEIDDKPGARDMAALAKQYRETLKEIDELEGTVSDGDEISEILAERETCGKSGAVRKNRT